MSKHTSGPWRKQNDGKSFSLWGNTGAGVFKIGTIKNDGSDSEANAALIAAAPEMYKLLQDIQAWFEGESFQYNEELDKVLNKAEGR